MSVGHRDAILAAATETFARFGFRKTSIDDIARRAGIAKGTVYVHFESKDELFGAVIRRIGVKATADLEASMKQARTPQAKVLAFLEGRNRQHAQLAADMRISQESLIELLAHAEPHIRQHVTREAAPLEDVLREGNAHGVFAVRSPGLVAAGMSACIQGAEAHLVGAAALELQGALAEVYDVFVRGLLASEDGPGRRRGRRSGASIGGA
jgi:AcrR family transcriptional regulator